VSRDLPTALATELLAAEITPFFAVELSFETSTLRFWSGLGEQVIGGDTYVGSGNMLSVSTIDETSEVAARGATLTLSGIPSELISLALQEPYQGRKCKIYFGARDANGEFLLQENGSLLLNEDGSAFSIAGDTESVMAEIFTGYIDQMNIDEGAETSTIAVGVESRLIDLQRPRVRRYTHESQKSRFPNDLGFQFVNDLQDKKFAWGR
jgi:hypothetical protein